MGLHITDLMSNKNTGHTVHVASVVIKARLAVWYTGRFGLRIMDGLTVWPMWQCE